MKNMRNMDCFCFSSRLIQCKIILLDEEELMHEIQDTSTGQALLDVAFLHLNLLETAYFGLRYLDSDGQTHWLDPDKKLYRQLKGHDPYLLYFGVKFYAADPCKLLEEITRYQFFLQVRQDILQGRLPVSFELAAELGAYIVQSELGDYDPRRHSPGYVSEFRFLSNQTTELESRIADLHKTLISQLPSVAELNYLDKVKWLEMYGVDLHPVLGEDNVEYFLGLTPSGIIVLRNKNIVGNYYWPRISKIYFKGRYFMLRVTDKNNDENTYGFETPSKPACKHLWKCCVEHHAFFRLIQVSPTTPDIFVLGSRFRSRIRKQPSCDSQMRIRNPPSFCRSSSRRYQRRIVEGALETPKLEESVKADLYHSQEIKHVSIPQPAQSLESPYKATCNTSTTLDIQNQRMDSPRSTHSAPWTQPHSRGLYNISVPPSPRSVRSAGPRYRSSSIDSQSSNDSRTCKRRKHHRSRWTSDNDSELSKGSNMSHRKHRRHRSRGNKRDSGSEPESHNHRHKLLNKNRHSESYYELVDSGSQWREVQKRQEGNLIQQASVIVNRRSGYVNNGLETESETSCHHRSRHRKHRSRSRSPSESKTWLPDELKKHLEFDLIDTTGMSESQLREIPYRVVQTNHAKQLKLKHMSWGKNDISLQNEKHLSYSPPPPYSPQASDACKIRGIRGFSTKTGYSTASGSSTPNNPNSLPRMLESLGLSDNCQYQQSIRSSKTRTCNSIKSCNSTNTVLSDLNNENTDLHPDSVSRVSHEHTDSGLGAEQECAYNSERSSDSVKHGVKNKSGSCNEARGVLIQTPVSKSDNNEYGILSPQDLYPQSSNPGHSKLKNMSSLMNPNSKNNVHKMNSERRYGSSLVSKCVPRTSVFGNMNIQYHNNTTVTTHTSNVDGNIAYKQFDSEGPSRRYTIEQSLVNAYPCSGDLSKARLTTADNNAAPAVAAPSLLYNDISKLASCSGGQPCSLGSATAIDNSSITDEPIASLQCRLNFNKHSATEYKSKDFVYFNQPVNLSQSNVNHFCISNSVADFNNGVIATQDDNKSNSASTNTNTASPVSIKSNNSHFSNGPPVHMSGELTEMSTEL